MTTIVLAHPNEHCPRFQVFGIYEAPNVHHAFEVQEYDAREDAEDVARQMMEIYEADHFRRVVEYQPGWGDFHGDPGSRCRGPGRR